MSTKDLTEQHQIFAMLADCSKGATNMNEVAKRFIEATKPTHSAMHVLDDKMVSIDNFLLKLTNELWIKEGVVH